MAQSEWSANLSAHQISLKKVDPENDIGNGFPIPQSGPEARAVLRSDHARAANISHGGALGFPSCSSGLGIGEICSSPHRIREANAKVHAHPAGSCDLIGRNYLPGVGLDLLFCRIAEPP